MRREEVKRGTGQVRFRPSRSFKKHPARNGGRSLTWEAGVTSPGTFIQISQRLTRMLAGGETCGATIPVAGWTATTAPTARHLTHVARIVGARQSHESHGLLASSTVSVAHSAKEPAAEAARAAGVNAHAWIDEATMPTVATISYRRHGSSQALISKGGKGMTHQSYRSKRKSHGCRSNPRTNVRFAKRFPLPII